MCIAWKTTILVIVQQLCHKLEFKALKYQKAHRTIIHFQFPTWQIGKKNCFELITAVELLIKAAFVTKKLVSCMCFILYNLQIPANGLSQGKNYTHKVTNEWLGRTNFHSLFQNSNSLNQKAHTRKMGGLGSNSHSPAPTSPLPQLSLILSALLPPLQEVY